MPSRRDFLTALVTGTAGCAGRRHGSTPTVTAVPTPTDDPYPEGVVEALGTSRFDESAVCPAAKPCFHQFESHERPEALVVPDRERVTPGMPELTTRTYNFGEEPLVVATEPYVAKYTSITWSPTVPFHETTTTEVIQPGGSLTRTFGMEGRGDGRFGFLERAQFGGPRGTVGMTVDGIDPDDPRFRFGAMFQVRGSAWSPSPAGVPAERDGDTLHIDPGATAETTLVLTTSDGTEGIPLVAETLAAHPPTNDAVLGLRSDGVDRVTAPTGTLSMKYLQLGMVLAQEIEPDMDLRLGDTIFNARTE